VKAVSDEQLIQWVADGDPSCLATLFERHHRAVYQYLLQMLRDRALCEDLVQDVFLKVLRKAERFRGEGTFKGWLFNIARNIAFDHLRKARRQEADELDETTMEPQMADHRSAEQDAAGKQKVKLVLQAMARLPAAVQEVIWLGRFEFDSYEELGQALSCNAGTARVRMHRAMEQLKSTYISLYGVTVDG
jgi:RNA polymerase sigma-70 factor (ECF subfamily)